MSLPLDEFLSRQIASIKLQLDEIAALAFDAERGEVRDDAEYIVKTAFNALDVDLGTFYHSIELGRPASYLGDPDDASTALRLRFEENLAASKQQVA